MSDRLDRASGALLGLAAGDAVGFPAMYHRQIAFPARRRLLWRRSLEADDALVNKLSMPYAQSAPLATMAFGPTDDAEQAALAARVLLALGDDPTGDELFDAWWKLVEPDQDSIWGSVADRSAINNARHGLRAPVTGNDNPHHYDDSSVARAVPVGIRWAGRPDQAAAVARRMAAITNADVGVDGAAAFASAVSVLVGGGEMDAAVAEARSQIPSASWIARNWDLAEVLLAEATDVFSAIPRWNDQISSRVYSYGNVIAETLPVAMIVARQSSAFSQALGLALMMPKQADTMPAMVGALVGGCIGASALPATWSAAVQELRGVCVPSTKGVRLADLASQLLGVGDSK